jgi:Ca-activated chloride channel family protein
MRKLLAAIVLVLAPAAALADGLIIVPPHPPEQPHLRNVPLYVRSHAVTVKVDGRVAVTEVDQVFANPNPRALEGTYLFPLPVGAAIDRFSMWIDGKEAAAELLDAEKARGIYEGIVREMRDPALLEYADRGLFKARVFPIDANGEKRVRIRYAEVLPADNGTVAYRYPLATEKFSSRPLESVSVAVTIDAGGPISSVFSPSHRVDTPKDLTGVAKVGWEARGVLPDRDFLLYWRPTKKDVGISVIAHRDPSDPEGTFLLVLAPRPAEDAKALPKDVVFVVDTSGSMAGPKIEQARNALRFCLRSLGPDDRFSIVPFSTEPRPFRDALVGADAANRAAAEKFVDAIEAAGGTAIDDALRTGLSMLGARAKDDARPAIVLFVTDGLPTIGETNVETILKNAASRSGDARLFVFGVGDDVNTKLLDRLAEDNRGARDYVSSTESIEEKVSNLYGKLAKPAMTDLELKVDGVETMAVLPRRLGDLFHGGEILVTGRYAKPGNAVVRLTGKVGGAVREIVEEVRFPETETRSEFLPRLWAVRRVGFLLDQIRLHGGPHARVADASPEPSDGSRIGGNFRDPRPAGVADPTNELVDEVVRLAKRFGIVTPYTSYLIVEDEGRRVRPMDGRTGAAPAPATPGFGLGGPSTGGGGGGSSGGGDAGGAAEPAADTPEEAAARSATGASAGKAKAAKEKDSGADAVDLARETLDLTRYEGAKDDEDGSAKRIVRHVAGRTFVSRGGVWFDAGADMTKERRVIEAFSDAYFALTRAHPGIAPWLQLGRVVLVVGDEVVEVRPPQ